MNHRVLLVVDDEPRIRAFVREALGDADLRVEEAATGMEALDLTATLVPDVILLDVHMPRLDGLRTLERLRQRPHLDRVPILMFTVERDAEMVTTAFALGADDYLAKPFDLETLEAKIAHWLATRPDHGLGAASRPSP